MKLAKKRFLRKNYRTVMLFGTFWTVSAAAQTETTLLDAIVVNGGTDSSYQALTPSSALRTDAPILDIPQAVNVVKSEVLKNQASRSLDDVLSNVSGITQTNGLGGTQDAFIRRGFGQNRDNAILTNGMKTVLPHSFNATTERVEVLKGPASTLFGILDPGGAINLETKKPEREFRGIASVTPSSFGGARAEFDVTGPVKGTPLAYRLIGSYNNTAYWRNFGRNKDWLIAPSVSWFGDKTVVTASFMYQSYKEPFDRGTIWDLDSGGPIPLSRRTRLDEPFNITDGHSSLASLNINHELSADWRLAFNYSYSNDRYTDNQARVMSYDPKTGDVTRRVDATQGSDNVGHSARLDLIGSETIAGMKHELLLGAEYDYHRTLRSDMIRCTPSVSFNINNPEYGTVDTCSRVVATDSDQYERLSSPSIYLQDSVHLNDQWIVVGGIRYQKYHQVAGRGRPFRTNTDTSGGKFVPRVGVVYKATPELSIYANIAKSFRPQSSISSEIGDLPPEEGLTYELGAKWDLARGLSANLAVYTTDKKNVSYFENVNGTIVTRAAGKVRSRGVELDVNGQLTDQLSIIASYGYTDAKIKDDPDYTGKQLVNVARHTASLFAAYDFGTLKNGDQLKIGAGIRGTSKRPGINDNSYFLPGYAVVDAFASYTISAKNPVTLQLNLRNLFDRTYFASSLGSSRYGNVYGEPFNASLTASVKF